LVSSISASSAIKETSAAKKKSARMPGNKYFADAPCGLPRPPSKPPLQARTSHRPQMGWQERGEIMTEERKLSAAETVKTASNYLRDPIAGEVDNGADHFGKEAETLLKFHGTYQQDDRDVREATRREGSGGKDDKRFIFMVRTKIPGGKLTSEQLLAELDLCDELGNTTLRCTTRQGLQLHGIVKRDMQRTLRRLHEVQLTTLGACGDVNRNVMCCPAPYRSRVHAQAQELTDRIAAHLAPRTSAYHDIWLTDIASGQRHAVVAADDVEPIYGRHYLPRKFKIAIGFPDDNCVDLHANDIGLLAIVEGDRIRGYNVLVGGGMGVTPSAKKTFPAVAQKMAFVTPEQALDVVTAIVGVQRDFGNREDRKQARMKYLIAHWGLERFKEKVEDYYGVPLAPPTSDDVRDFNDHMGWEQQGDGRLFYGLNIENGRIKDTDTIRMKSAIREICRSLNPGIRLTAHQSILFTNLEDSRRGQLEAILRDHQVPLSAEVSTVRRWSMACVAWPTCGLSITEAERALPGIIDQLETELATLGLADERFTVRMTGCPNGCARPYNCDIGLVGKTKGKYSIFVGGRLLGDRLNFLFKDFVTEQEIVSTVRPLFVYFRKERQGNETFGDFCFRKGAEDLLAWCEKEAASNAA
jgi:sulfite reductase (ferredoxin)